MKKFIAVITAMLMVLSLVPAAMAENETTDTAEHFMLTYQNFKWSADSSVALQDDSVTLKGVDKKILISGGKNNNYVTAKVYSEKDCTCYVSALLQYTANNRYPEAYVNDTEIANELTWNTTGYSDWFQLKNATLKKGWNEIKFGMKANWDNYYLRAVYITTEDNDEISLDTDETKLALYGDVTAPVFASDAKVTTAQSVGSFKVKFPQATDAHTVHYSYTVDGTETAIADITKPVDFSSYSGEKSVTLTAADAWGNKADKTFTVTVPELYTRILLNRTNFADVAINDGWNTSFLYNKNAFYVKYDYSDKNWYLPSAMFYIDTAGTYNIHILKWINSTITERVPIAIIDGDEENKITYTHEKDAKWEAKEYTLAKGWHKLQFTVSAQDKPYSINAVYITNDLTEKITIDNDDSLTTYLSGGVGINGAVYDAKGLAKAGVEADCGYINLTPIKALAAADGATATVNGNDAEWGTARKLSLSELENNVNIVSSDKSQDAAFTVINLGTEYTTDSATLSNQAESAYKGADGKRPAYSLGENGSATWSISGVSGKRDVWVYQIGAGENGCNSSPAEIKAGGTTHTATFNNSGETSQWIKLGTYTFNGDDEYVKISGSESGTVYVDSIKLTYADELIPVSTAVTTEDGSVAFEYKYYKQTDAAQSIAAAAAAYNGDGKLTDFTLNTTPAVKGMNIFKTNGLTGGTAYKGFIFNSAAALAPLAAAVDYPNN